MSNTMTIHHDLSDLLAEQCKEAFAQPVAYQSAYRCGGATLTETIDEVARLKELLSDHSATLAQVVASLSDEIKFLQDRLLYVTDCQRLFDIK